MPVRIRTRTLSPKGKHMDLNLVQPIATPVEASEYSADNAASLTRPATKAKPARPSTGRHFPTSAVAPPSEAEQPAVPRPPAIEFFKPTDLRDYQPLTNTVLVGDCHITQGSVFVIGGAPGVGKSRASVALAMAGSTGQQWFGLTVHRRFKTLIIQNENGRLRLGKEFADLPCGELVDWILVSAPPPFGLAFDQPNFCTTLKTCIADFKPDVVLIDPWNAAARDEKARDYLEAFNAIRSVIPAGDTGPALGIVAHTRKPTANERATGRGLLNLLAGSYVLGSVPRSVFVLQAASDAPEDDRVVWTCCKNNDGELGAPSAWQRRNGVFAPVPDFDWLAFDKPGEERRGVTEEDVAALFQHGRRKCAKKQAVEGLMESTGFGQSACYTALSLTGKFAAHLVEDENRLLIWKP